MGTACPSAPSWTIVCDQVGEFQIVVMRVKEAGLCSSPKDPFTGQASEFQKSPPAAQGDASGFRVAVQPSLIILLLG